MSETEETLRETLEAALDAATEPEVPTETETKPNGADPAPEASGSPDEPLPEPETAPTEAAETAEAPDSGLTFEPVVEETSEAPKEKLPRSLGRPPGDWAPEAREHWDELPEAVKVAVRRQTANVGQTMRDTAEARQFQTQFNDVVAPFRTLMEAKRVDPLTATRNLMQVEAGLTMGTPQQKAAIAADIIRSYNVDVNALDDLLSGHGNGADPAHNGLLQAIDQRLAPLQQFMGDFQKARATREQANQAESAQQVAEFEAEHEFVDDVRDDMALLLETAGRAGREMSLDQAYSLAVAQRPDLQKIVQQRQGAQAAAAQNKSLEAKKRAASSPVGAQSTAAPVKPTDLRGQLEAAVRFHENS